jgi:integrase
MFETAVEDNAARANPVRGVRIPPAAANGDGEEPTQAVTREELSLLLAEVPESWRLFFELLTHTGVRISEAIGLTWEHIELGAQLRLLVREQFYRGKRRRLKSKYGRRDVPLSAGRVGSPSCVGTPTGATKPRCSQPATGPSCTPRTSPVAS